MPTTGFRIYEYNAQLVASGLFDDGLSVFAVAADGALTNVVKCRRQWVAEVERRRLPHDGGSRWRVFLFATGLNDDGVSVFSFGSDGSLTNVANVGDNAALERDGVTDVATGHIHSPRD